MIPHHTLSQYKTQNFKMKIQAIGKFISCRTEKVKLEDLTICSWLQVFGWPIIGTDCSGM